MELHENTEKQERALLVAVDTGSYDVEASLAELYELTKTAGAEPFGAMTQKRPALASLHLNPVNLNHIPSKPHTENLFIRYNLRLPPLPNSFLVKPSTY